MIIKPGIRCGLVVPKETLKPYRLPARGIVTEVGPPRATVLVEEVWEYSNIVELGLIELETPIDLELGWVEVPRLLSSPEAFTVTYPTKGLFSPDPLKFQVVINKLLMEQLH